MPCFYIAPETSMARERVSSGARGVFGWADLGIASSLDGGVLVMWDGGLTVLAGHLAPSERGG
jgi:hypothetical protein